MKIIKDPSKEQLSQLQAILEKDKDAEIMDIFGNCISQYLAIEVEEKIVASVAIRVIHGELSGELELFKLYVAPSHRKRGLGERLFKETVEFGVANGLDKLSIQMIGGSCPFWKKITSKHQIENCFDDKLTIVIP